MKIGEQLKEIRQKAGISQEKLAEMSGIPQGSISKIENGTRDFAFSTLQKLLDALKCEVRIIEKK